MGPEPTITYWQRRAVAAAMVLVLVLVLRWLVGGLGGADTVASAAPQPSASAASASAGPSASPTPGPCDPAALQITATADQASYAVGGRPELVLAVTTSGANPCQRDLGQGAVELIVFSGTDRIWSSDDCAPGGPAKVTTVEPGTPVTTKVTWSGRRSLTGCAGPQGQAGAGTYRVSARVGDLSVDGGTFRLTD